MFSLRFRSDLSQFGNVATYSREHQAFGSHKSWCCGKTFQMGIKFGIKLKCIRISDKMGWNYIWRIILISMNPEILNYGVHTKTFSTRHSIRFWVFLSKIVIYDLWLFQCFLVFFNSLYQELLGYVSYISLVFHIFSQEVLEHRPFCSFSW